MRRRLAATCSCALLLAPAGPPRETIEIAFQAVRESRGSPQSLKQLTNCGPTAAHDLYQRLARSDDPVERGWALVGLGHLGGTTSERKLRRWIDCRAATPLERSLAAAAWIRQATWKSLSRRWRKLIQLPAVAPALAHRFASSMDDEQWNRFLLDELLFDKEIEATRLAAVLLSRGPAPLVRLLFESDEVDVRRAASATLGGLAQAGHTTVTTALLRSLRYRKGAEDFPWGRGALFLPDAFPDRASSRDVIGSLIAWALAEDLPPRKASREQVSRALNSLRLIRAADMGQGIHPGYTARNWLEHVGRHAGFAAAYSILESLGRERDPRLLKLLPRS